MNQTLSTEETTEKPEAEADCSAPICSPKVFVWATPGATQFGGVAGHAIAEDGTGLAGHISSNESWAKLDMTSDYKKKDYAEHYPDGYEIEWIDYDDLEGHAAFNHAFRRHEEIHRENAVLTHTDDNAQ